MIPHQYSIEDENYNFLDKSVSRNTNEKVTTLVQENYQQPETNFVAPAHHSTKKKLLGVGGTTSAVAASASRHSNNHQHHHQHRRRHDVIVKQRYETCSNNGRLAPKSCDCEVFALGDKGQYIHGCKKLMLAADDKNGQLQLLNNDNNNKLAIDTKRKSEKDFVRTGDLVENRFQVIKKLCQGGFGQVYTAIDLHSNEQVALKLEKKDEECAAASIECKVLRRLSGRKHCPILYSYGENEVFTFVAMQLLGKSLSDIRRDCNLKPQRMSIQATLNVATQCLSALQTLHDIGYLHRDVKPSNFAVGSSYRDVDTVYIIDFGLCRRYLESNNQIKAPRDNVGFRGTVRYASLNAHHGNELSRADDCTSLFYAVIELLYGRLPWRSTNDKQAVADLKVEYSPEKLCRDLPVEFSTFATHLKSLSYTDRPNYRLLRELMNRASGRFNKRWPIPDSRDQISGSVAAELNSQDAPSLGSSISQSMQCSMDEDRIIYDWLVKDCSHLCHLYCES